MFCLYFIIFLKVYDGTSESARQIASLEGAVGDRVVYSTGSYMFISFTSDHSQVDTGFAATYSIVEASKTHRITKYENQN